MSRLDPSPSMAARTRSSRASGWPVRRTPRWILLVGVAIAAIAVTVNLVHQPSRAERASDLRGFLQEVTTDIESCAGGVGESLTALRDVQTGDSSASDGRDAIGIARQGAANCSPANNEQIDDLASYQVPESLGSFHLAGVVTGLVTWAAPDAEQVQTDIAQVLTAANPVAKSQAEAALSRALSKLAAQRSAVDAVMDAAIKSLAVHASPPRLPG
jgi:hypothetical protein